MSRKILVVVDMQKDFVTGVLGTKEATAIVPDMVKYIENFDGQVIYTLDTHPKNYSETQEGRKLPVPHCIEGTEGWQLVDELEELRKKKDSMVFQKVTFGSTDLAQYLKAENEKEAIESITLIGVCTDICVVSNAMTIKAHLPETELQVVAGLTAATTPATQAEALHIMACCQVTVIE